MNILYCFDIPNKPNRLSVFSKLDELSALSEAIAQSNKISSTLAFTTSSFSYLDLRLTPTLALCLAFVSILLSSKKLFKQFMQIYIETVRNQAPQLVN